MLRVEKTLEISIPRDGLDVNRLEEVLLQEIRRFGKELWESVLVSLEETILMEREGEVIRKRRVSRHLLTRLGWIRFQRYQVAKEGEEKKVYRYLLDEVLGLEPNQRETLGVRKRGVELASDHPYRQAAELLGQEIGEEVSHRTLHRWVSVKDPCGTGGGEKVARGRGGQKAEGLRGGDTLPSESCPSGHCKCKDEGEEEQEIVVVEVDGTMLSSQEERGERFEMKLGLMYTGKELESKEAKRRRYRLKEKVLYGGVEEAEAFGEKLYLRGEEKLSLGGAKHLLFIGDGAKWINEIAGADYWKSVYQLDWWHYRRKLKEALRGEEKLVRELMRLLREGKREEHRRLLRLRRMMIREEDEKLDELLDYLEENWEGLYGSWGLRGKVKAQEVLVVGSGAVEKNIEIVIGRRFKKRGMSWSREGANNLLKLRVERQEPDAWQRWWQRRAA
ncbi:MAG TPA: hypothetical protein DCP08_07015 [Chloroflexi bacterium]|nr:hypothetical protein [Chloroflexota bacterium]